MTTGRRHLERQAGSRLAAHIGQIRDRRFIVDEVVIGFVGPRGNTVECIDDLAQVRGNPNRTL